MNAFIWSNIEVNIAVLSACLPTFRPLIQALLPSNLGSRPTEFVEPRARGREYKDAMGARSHYSMNGFQFLPDSVGQENLISSGQRSIQHHMSSDGIKVTHKISTESEILFN